MPTMVAATVVTFDAIDVAGLADGDRIRLLLDVDRLVEVFEDPVEERERGLHLETDAE